MTNRNTAVGQRFWRMIKEFAAGVNTASAIAHNNRPSTSSISRVQQREFWEVEIGDMFPRREDCAD